MILSNCVVLEREGGWDGKGDRKGIEGGREGQLGSKYSKMTDVDIGFCYWRHIHIQLLFL